MACSFPVDVGHPRPLGNEGWSPAAMVYTILALDARRRVRREAPAETLAEAERQADAWFADDAEIMFAVVLDEVRAVILKEVERAGTMSFGDGADSDDRSE